MSDVLRIHTILRQGCFDLLTGFKATTGKLANVARYRPPSYNTPAGFVGIITEPAIRRTEAIIQRTPLAEVWMVWGAYDTAETADRQDDASDDWYEYCDAHLGEADPRTLLELQSIDSGLDLEIRSASGPVTHYIATRSVLRLSAAGGGLWQ